MSSQPMPARWSLWVLGIGLGLFWVVAIGGVALIASGWRPESPAKIPPFGATIQQCEAVFGRPLEISSDTDWLHRPGRLYYSGGWSVIVGFDEQGRIEQFTFSKTKLPLIPIPPMNPAEQKTLLDRFKEDSTWTAHAPIDSGPSWYRADNKVFAFYITRWRWMILMNEAGMERSANALQRRQNAH